MEIEDIKKDLKFAAIILMMDVTHFGMSLQLYSDILSSKDGTVLGEKRGPDDK
jgi:hypothetical protein